MSKIYNDVVFGGVAWSDDESKVCFVGEIPEPAAYKNPWENKKTEEEEKKAAAEEEKKEEEKKEEEKKEEEKKEEEKKEEHFQDEKFLLNRDFGEMLVDKKNPGIFVFDLQKNSINQV